MSENSTVPPSSKMNVEKKKIVLVVVAVLLLTSFLVVLSLRNGKKSKPRLSPPESKTLKPHPEKQRIVTRRFFEPHLLGQDYLNIIPNPSFPAFPAAIRILSHLCRYEVECQKSDRWSRAYDSEFRAEAFAQDLPKVTDLATSLRALGQERGVTFVELPEGFDTVDTDWTGKGNDLLLRYNTKVGDGVLYDGKFTILKLIAFKTEDALYLRSTDWIKIPDVQESTLEWGIKHENLQDINAEVLIYTRFDGLD